MPGEVWLVRHAETDWAKAGKHTGRTDVPLNDDGRAHAASLPQRLSGQRFAAVYASPLSRARETAEIAGYGDRAQLLDDLLEYDYGDYEGLTTPEIREQRPDWFLWRDGVPDGETPDDVGARTDRVIAKVLESDGDVALFAHGHVLRVLGARWVEQPAALGGRLALSTGALCRLGFERETRVIRAWNF
ncbi:Acid phosphatase [Baekduia alba]|uniref:histidine phosphatase family protein n=1 Tax=Baekduia alba TaxID=2997333 RepID=UPI0023422013|nr:histidine phosphatase family protein [Baekduia alba]WCB92637.1 Acid phosphatase [Baekduia alba]